MIRLELIGNLTRDPETRTVQKGESGGKVCNFTVAYPVNPVRLFIRFFGKLSNFYRKIKIPESFVINDSGLWSIGDSNS